MKTVCPQGRVGSNPTPCAFFCLKTDVQKKTKKFLTNEKHFDRINKLSQDRELKTEFKKIKKCLTDEWECDKMYELLKKSNKTLKNKLKKFLTNEKFCDKINELVRVGTAKILDN